MALLLDGKATAKSFLQKQAQEIARLAEQFGKPKLVVVLVGDNPASKIYVRKKEKTVQKAGAAIDVKRLPATISQQELLDEVISLNEDQSVTAILVQLPLPEHIDKQTILCALTKEKDIDGLHPDNLALLLEGNETVVPCTPLGIIKLLETYGVGFAGKHVVVCGYSNLVGLPVGAMCKNRGATITYCRKRWNNIHETVKGDILISATGVAGLINADRVKEHAVVVDVGINRNSEGKLVGDVAFDAVKGKASWITPVPGGVGPMTVAMVVENLIRLYKAQQKEQLRQEMKALRDQINVEEKNKVIAETLLGLPLYQQASKVLFYVHKGHEVGTEQLIQQALNVGKRVFVPFVKEHELAVSEITSLADLEKGAFAIREPKVSLRKELDASELAALDVVVVPGVVFDKQGNRIGFGKGYYDRLLPKCKGVKLGLAFSEQIKEDLSLLVSDLDVQLDGVIHNGILHRSKKTTN